MLLIPKWKLLNSVIRIIRNNIRNDICIITVHCTCIIFMRLPNKLHEHHILHGQLTLYMQLQYRVMQMSLHIYSGVGTIEAVRQLPQRKFGSLIINVLNLCKHCIIIISLCHGEITHD